MTDSDERKGNGHVTGKYGHAANSPALTRSRSVHVVIDGNEQGAGNADKTVKRKHGPTKSDSSNLLSCLYAVINILISLLFPLTEALHDKWLNTEYYTAFLVYQWLVASAFLLYLQFYLFRQPHSHHHAKRKPKVFDASQIKASASGIHITNASEQSKTAPEPSRAESKYRKVLKHFKSSRGASGGHSETPEAGDSNGHAEVGGQNRAQSGGNISAMIRYSSSCANLNTKDTEAMYDRRNAHTDFSDLFQNGDALQRAQSSGSLDLNQEGLGEYVDEETEVWIDAGRLGNLFSHEGSSFYLRMGCVLFAIGHIIYVSLELQTSSQSVKGCPDTPYWWIYIVRLIFVLLQTFFIFKHPAITIQKHEPLVRFGFMHLIATNMGVWIRTLINEIYLEYNHLEHINKTDPSELPDINVWQYGKQPLAGGEDTPNCRGVLQSAAQYLFPFVLEYSLIAMGTFIIMYFSINEHSSNDVVQGLSNLLRIHALEEEPTGGKDDDKNSVSSQSSNPEEHENILRKSHRGLFAGILLLSGSIISTVMFFFQISQNPITAQILYLSTDIGIHVLLTLSGVVAIARLNVLNYVEKPASVDDVLLLLSMAGAIIFELTMLIAAADHLTAGGNTEIKTSILAVCSGLVASIQSVVQVILIASGMRRYPSKRYHVNSMPGRGHITFLLVGNIAIWIYRTLQAKELALHEVEMDYYGSLTWLLLVNISLPLLLFFRFHSSICLADVWHSSYTPLHQKIPKAQPPPGSSSSPSGYSKRDPGRFGVGIRDEGDVGDRLSVSGLIRSVSMGNLSAVAASEARSRHSRLGRGFDNMGAELEDTGSLGYNGRSQM